jgi:hypothetical protein
LIVPHQVLYDLVLDGPEKNKILEVKEACIKSDAAVQTVVGGVRQQAWRVLGLDLPIGTAPMPVSDPTGQSLPGGGVGFSPK